jgi:hypothetical protein
VIIHLCDICENQIIGNNYATIGIPVELEMKIYEVCGTDCALTALNAVFGEEDEDEIPENLLRHLAETATSEEEEGEQLRPEPPQKEDEEIPFRPALRPNRRSPDETVENEKKFKKQAAEASNQVTQVRRRGFDTR